MIRHGLAGELGTAPPLKQQQCLRDQLHSQGLVFTKSLSLSPLSFLYLILTTACARIPGPNPALGYHRILRVGRHHKDHRVQLLCEQPIKGSNPQSWGYEYQALTNRADVSLSTAPLQGRPSEEGRTQRGLLCLRTPDHSQRPLQSCQCTQPEPQIPGFKGKQSIKRSHPSPPLVPAALTL